MSGAETRPRAYRSELRQQQAAQTRRRIIEAAIEEFSHHGYQAATLAQIAKRAGVSIETVQKQGPKTALLWAAVEVASFGVEGRGLDFLTTGYGMAMLKIPDPDGFATFIGETFLVLNEPTAGVWTAVTGVAPADSELRGQFVERLAEIREQVENVLRVVAERGWLRTDVPFDDLVEAFCVIISVETYVRFVRLDGRSPGQYKAFLTRTVRDTILRR
ncbi:TetR/AcrR family transcriptional regulator [Virgisporangium aurantiacum]|uniref:TetR family transcriptional regulator n=1 Tax=Virgisporangium aurantiacum TaxID=175570 RepID=A0A8J3ZDA1_9ACTN|nr:TetR/AcrR family transcriptional regulator [Virgisporangium aurantiacum]GIJ61831.1 TetR family transcriptional regulator [Virgisporangium aurantiacum]